MYICNVSTYMLYAICSVYRLVYVHAYIGTYMCDYHLLGTYCTYPCTCVLPCTCVHMYSVYCQCMTTLYVLLVLFVLCVCIQATHTMYCTYVRCMYVTLYTHIQCHAVCATSVYFTCFQFVTSMLYSFEPHTIAGFPRSYD